MLLVQLRSTALLTLHTVTTTSHDSSSCCSNDPRLDCGSDTDQDHSLASAVLGAYMSHMPPSPCVADGVCRLDFKGCNITGSSWNTAALGPLIKIPPYDKVRVVCILTMHGSGTTSTPHMLYVEAHSM